MKYVFQRLVDGANVELEYAMSDAPAYGALIDHPQHGPCRRLLSPSQSGAKRTVQPFVGRQFPPGTAQRLGHKHVDRHGQPIFRGRKDAEEFAARSDGEYVYDGMPARAETRHRTPAKELARRRGLL